MGKKVNDKVTVESPNGSFDIEIVKEQKDRMKKW